MSHVLQIRYDDDVLLQANLRREEFVHEAPILLAGKLYELGRLSSVRAAQLCCMERVQFLMALPPICFAMSVLGSDDIAHEIRFAHRAWPLVILPAPSSPSVWLRRLTVGRLPFGSGADRGGRRDRGRAKRDTASPWGWVSVAARSSAVAGQSTSTLAGCGRVALDRHIGMVAIDWARGRAASAAGLTVTGSLGLGLARPAGWCQRWRLRRSDAIQGVYPDDTLVNRFLAAMGESHT